MSGHSFLYMGRGEFAAEYLSELESLPFCTELVRSKHLAIADDQPQLIDVILLEANAMIAESGDDLSKLIHTLAPYPVIALTEKAH